MGIAQSSEGVGDRSRRLVERLYLEHGANAARLAQLMTGQPMLAEDIVQEAFVRFLGRVPRLRDPDAARAYLMRAVVNLSKNHRRRAGIERSYVAAHHPASHEAFVVPDLDEREDLLRALQSLPHRQRAAVVLRYCEDLSEQKTAELLHTSRKAVRSLVARGMTTLRAQVRGGNDGPA